MDLEALRRSRRVCSAAVLLSAIALVVTKSSAHRSAPGASLPGVVAASCFVISLLLFVVIWRKERAKSELGFAERERAQLHLLELQVGLAKTKQKTPTDEDQQDRPSS